MYSDFLFGTVGSPKSTPARPGGSVGAITQISTLGLQALELGWVQSVRVTAETCQAINKASRELNIRLSVHAPYFINLNADDEEWPKSKKRLLDACYYGNLAGATDIIFHPGSLFGQPSHEVLPKITTRLNVCISELRLQKNPVILRPETMGKAALIGSIEDTISLSREIPGVEPCIDFAHIHARDGKGGFNSFREWEQLLNGYAKALGDEALNRLHIHLSGIEYSAKGERNHIPLQESDINLKDLFRVLKQFSCQGRILCESPVMEEDALLIQKLWKELD